MAVDDSALAPLVFYAEIAVDDVRQSRPANSTRVTSLEAGPAGTGDLAGPVDAWHQLETAPSEAASDRRHSGQHVRRHEDGFQEAGLSGYGTIWREDRYSR